MKKSMELICQELGMNMTTAFTIFAKKMSREKRIPFEVSIDPFYSDSKLRCKMRKFGLMKCGMIIPTGKPKIKKHLKGLTN